MLIKISAKLCSKCEMHYFILFKACLLFIHKIKHLQKVPSLNKLQSYYTLGCTAVKILLTLTYVNIPSCPQAKF